LKHVIGQADDTTSDHIQEVHTETDVLWPTWPLSDPLTPPETTESDYERNTLSVDMNHTAVLLFFGW